MTTCIQYEQSIERQDDSVRASISQSTTKPGLQTERARSIRSRLTSFFEWPLSITICSFRTPSTFPKSVLRPRHGARQVCRQLHHEATLRSFSSSLDIPRDPPIELPRARQRPDQPSRYHQRSKLTKVRARGDTQTKRGSRSGTGSVEPDADRRARCTAELHGSGVHNLVQGACV